MHYPQNSKSYLNCNESVIFLPTNFPEEPDLICLITSPDTRDVLSKFLSALIKTSEIIMKKYIGITGIMLALLLQGCGSTRPTWEQNPIQQRNDEPTKSYELGREYKVAVGDAIVSAEKGNFITYYEPLSEDVEIWDGDTFNDFDDEYPLADRKWFPKYKFKGADGDYILVSQAFEDGEVGIIVYDNGSIPQNPVIKANSDGSSKRYPIESKLGSNQLFRKITVPLSETHMFKFELIYTGKTKNTISVVYREYVDSFAKSSFFQNLTYDLDESSDIKFKTIEIRVLNSTNSELIFKVLKDGDLNWVP